MPSSSAHTAGGSGISRNADSSAAGGSLPLVGACVSAAAASLQLRPARQPSATAVGLAWVITPRAIISAPSPIRAVAWPTVAAGMPSLREIVEPGNPGLVAPDPGIVKDCRRNTELGRDIGGINATMRAVDDDRTFGFGADAGDAVGGQDRRGLGGHGSGLVQKGSCPPSCRDRQNMHKANPIRRRQLLSMKMIHARLSAVARCGRIAEPEFRRYNGWWRIRDRRSRGNGRTVACRSALSAPGRWAHRLPAA